MRQRLRDVFRGPVVFYPLLFAAFPVLFLYAYNISQTSASQVWLPLGVSVGGALVLWAVLSLILRSLSKAGLATAIFLALFFSYGRLYDGLHYLGVSMPKHAHLLPSMLFIWGYCVYFIGRSKRDLRITTWLLNVVAVAVIAINLFNIAGYEIRLAGAEAVTPPDTSEQAAASPAELGELPDIYFIILDEYAHPDTMLEWYDYDNSEFIQGLEDRGFFVAHESRTRTPNSNEAMASVLNMEYLAGVHYWDETRNVYVEGTSGEAKNFGDPVRTQMLYHKIGYSKTADFLRAQGYKYVVFGSWYTSERWDHYTNDVADLRFNYFEEAASPWASEFQEILWNTTMLRPFYYQLAGGHYETPHRRVTLHTLEHLKALPEVEGPKFVFAPIISPHSPYVFGPTGEFIATPNWYNHQDRQFYLGQYVFISSEIEKVVDELLMKSDVPPIIILQSDHGIRPHYSGMNIGGDEWQKILNAMYLPGMDYAEISDSISPVNTFRLIFNHYFGAEYPLLEDD